MLFSKRAGVGRWIVLAAALSSGGLSSYLVVQRELLFGGTAFLLMYAVAVFAVALPLIACQGEVGQRISNASPLLGFVIRWGALAALLAAALRLVYTALSLRYLIKGAGGSDPVAYFLGQVLRISPEPFSFGLPLWSELMLYSVIFILLYLITQRERWLSAVLFALLGISLIVLFVGVFSTSSPALFTELWAPDWSYLLNIGAWKRATVEALYSLSVYSGFFIFLGRELEGRPSRSALFLVLGLHTALVVLWSAFFAGQLAFLSESLGLDVFLSGGQGILIPFALVPGALLLEGPSDLLRVVFFSLLLLLLANISSLVLLSGKILYSSLRTPLFLTLGGLILLASSLFGPSGGVLRLDIAERFLRHLAGPLIVLVSLIGVRTVLGEKSRVFTGFYAGIMLLILAANILEEIAAPYGNYELKALLFFGWFLAVLVPAILALFVTLKNKGHHDLW